MATDYHPLHDNLAADPEAWVSHVAAGIKAKLGDEYDFEGLSDKDVIQRHYSRFGKGMSPEGYQAKLNVVYGKDFAVPPPKPEEKKPLLQRAKETAAAVPQMAKETAVGLAPFAVPAAVQAIPKVGAAIAGRVPGASQIGALAGHATSALVDAATKQALQATQAGVQPIDVPAKTQEFYSRLQPGLSARGYTDEQIMQEARQRAENLDAGQRQTTESIDQDIQQVETEAALEPVKAATDAVFFGLGAPKVIGALQKGMEKVGLAKAAQVAGQPVTKAIGGAAGRVAEHVKTGVIVGVPGMALQEGATHAVMSAAENESPTDVAKALVTGAQAGAFHGAVGGAILGAAAGGAEEAAGAALRPVVQRKRMAEYKLNVARERAEAERHGKDVTAINATADGFNPARSKVPIDSAEPADVATSIIQAEHGEQAALSEAGLRAASRIEERIRLYHDANAEVGKFGEREIPLGPTERAAVPPAVPGLGPVERAGVEPPPVEPNARELPPAEHENLGAPLPTGPTIEPNARVMPTTPAEPLAIERGPAAVEPPFNIERPAGPSPVGPAPAPAEIHPMGAPAPASAEAPAGLREITLPSRAESAIKAMDVGKRATVTVGEGGSVHLERLGPVGEQGKPGEAAQTLDQIVRRADEHQVPVTVGLTQVAGPRGGKIPLEKLVPWYESRGFKLTESTKLPEGQMATARMTREPSPPPATKMSVLEAQGEMMKRAMANPETPSAKALAAPAVAPAPGRWHQSNLWADANITAARERILARESEFPEQERLRNRESGHLGEKEGYRDPTSYDWADFADRVQIGVNVMLKHGLNKAEWVEHMVKELGGKFRAVADKVYQEAVAVYNARRPKGVDDVRRVVDDYTHQSGLGRGATRHDFYPEVDPRFATRVATAYDQMKNAKPGTPEHDAAVQSYEALNHEVDLQFEAMKKAGYDVEFSTADPYPTSADMRADVANNKHLRVFKTPDENFHPFMTPEQNDRFRAVHDFFTHAAEGYEFGPRGEDAAFRKHASTLSTKAVPALATETRGQNSWVNFMPKNAKKAPADRPFAPQKFALLPEWTYEDVIKERASRALTNRLSKGATPLSPRGEGRAMVAAAEKLARGVRPVKASPAVRARFTSNGASAINEMMAVSPESAHWYHDDIEKMHRLTEQEIPSLAKPGHRALFDLLLGFTSPNTNVPQNYARAVTLMRDFERSGKVPFLQRFGQEVNIGSRKWVPRLNRMIDKFGGDLDAMREYLLTKDPETGVYNVEKEFGEKVGPFTLNIQGIHDQITVDVWIVRRLRRLSGTLHKNVEGKRTLSEQWAPTAQERRDIEASIHELSQQTGLDPDAVQAVLWDNEKMVWERAGLAAPRIPFSVAAEKVLANMRERGTEIGKHLEGPDQQNLFKERP